MHDSVLSVIVSSVYVHQLFGIPLSIPFVTPKPFLTFKRHLKSHLLLTAFNITLASPTMRPDSLLILALYKC